MSNACTEARIIASTVRAIIFDSRDVDQNVAHKAIDNLDFHVNIARDAFRKASCAEDAVRAADLASYFESVVRATEEASYAKDAVRATDLTSYAKDAVRATEEAFYAKDAVRVAYLASYFESTVRATEEASYAKDAVRFDDLASYAKNAVLIADLFYYTNANAFLNLQVNIIIERLGSFRAHPSLPTALKPQ